LANEKFAGITPMMVLGSTFPPKSATRNRFPNTSGAPPKRRCHRSKLMSMTRSASALSSSCVNQRPIIGRVPTAIADR
jgi:hypothetical protein